MLAAFSPYLNESGYIQDALLKWNMMNGMQKGSSE